MTGRERVLRTMRGEPVDSLANMAITMMKAAAEVGVPYRTYALDADAHVRGQLAITRKFDTDHVSCISDPGVEAADLGAEIIYREDAPPTPDESRPLIDEPSRLHRMRLPDPWSSPRMRKRLAVISQLKEQVAGEKAVEGWIEGPIAESADLRGVSRIMIDFYDSPSFVRDLIAFVVDLELAFGRAQVEAGADYIGIGDAAASLVGPEMYREFVFEAEKRYVAELHRIGVPVRLHICGQTTPLLPMLAELGADLIDLDSMVSIAEARKVLGPKQCIAGNINPVSDLKDGTPQLVTEKLSTCFRDAGETAWAVAAGCEVPRATPDENLLAMGRFARAHTLKKKT
ncbi:MAG TPA: uroporphyrinogen decarboxylase family protein [Spirochaetia bacterium]